MNVELAVPRGFRAGDRIDLPVVVHNNTNAARKVQGATQAGGQQALPWAERTAPAGGDFAFTIPLAAAGCRPVELLASVRAEDGAADAIRRELVPLPRIPLVTRRWSGPLNKGTVRRVC